jgi:hypothetical protein
MNQCDLWWQRTRTYIIKQLRKAEQWKQAHRKIQLGHVPDELVEVSDLIIPRLRYSVTTTDKRQTTSFSDSH